MQYRVLGPLEVDQDDRLLPLGGAKQRALLALLVLNANRVVSREQLIDELWGDEPPETVVTVVQVYVSRLRKLLPPATLVTRSPGYLLSADPETIDLLRFERLVDDARQADPERASRLLREALALWRGRPLAEFASESFAQVEGGRLDELRVAALEERIEADLALGRHAALIGELEVLTREHPHRERLRSQLLLALYRSGRQAEALEAYRQARAALDEVGVEPGERLRQLERAILTQNPALAIPPPLLPAAPGVPETLRLRPSSPFVGRGRELSTLRSLMQRAEDGDGQVALLGGEAGGGKTRLVREFAHDAAERGTLVLYGSADAVVNAPYQPFVQALEFLLRVSDADALDDYLGAGREALARLLPGLGPAPTVAQGDPETERRRLHGAVVDLLTRVGEQRPLLVVVDDIHWADVPSLHLVVHLARAIPAARLLLVATHRDRSEDMRPEFSDALAALARVDGVTRLALAGLSDDEVAAFIRSSTAAEDESGVAKLATDLHALTDGTPFLLCELWRALIEAEAVQTSGGTLRLSRPLAELTSPEGVREVVHYRLSRLERSTTDMLEIAAVVGGEFELRVLEETLDRTTLLSSLEEALSSGTIEELPGPRLSHRFAHDLVRRALYDRLSAVRRAELHLRVGEALERVHAADVEPVLPELAHHFAVAAPLAGSDRAADYNVRAAEAAMGAFALEEAAKRLSTALELGVSDARTRGRLELELARALWLTGHRERSAQLLDDALVSARRAGDEQTEWYVRLEEAGAPGRDPGELETLARQAVEVFERLDDRLGLARAHHRVALAANYRCAFGEGALASERALDHAVASGAGQEEARMVDALCTALLYGPAPASSGVERCHELLEQASASPMTQAVILSSLAGLEAMTGRLDEARTAYRRAGAIYSELDLPFFVAALSAIAGPIELLADNAEGAEKMLRAGIELLADRGLADAIAYRSALLALTLLAQEKHEQAAGALGDAEPTRLMTRITHDIAAARLHDDLATARRAVELASDTEAVNLHADARKTLGDLLASRTSDDAKVQHAIALELYERKGNELGARPLRAAVSRV